MTQKQRHDAKHIAKVRTPEAIHAIPNQEGSKTEIRLSGHPHLPCLTYNWQRQGKGDRRLPKTGRDVLFTVFGELRHCRYVHQPKTLFRRSDSKLSRLNVVDHHDGMPEGGERKQGII